MARYTVGLFEQALNKRLEEMSAHSEEYQSTVEKLRSERDQLRCEADRIVSAIAAAGHSPALLKKLAEAEEKIASIKARIEAHRPPDVKHAVTEVRDYAYKAIFDMKSLFHAVSQKAKVKLAQHIKELVLTPKERDGEWVYDVTGDMELLPEMKCVILMVARDGIEPPTRGFSVRCSTS